MKDTAVADGSAGGPTRITVVVLGDGHAGKSSIIHCLSGRGTITADSPYRPTLGAEESVASARVSFVPVEIILWDYPGHERFSAGAPSRRVPSDLALLVVDVTKPEPLRHLDAWHDEYVRSCVGSAVMPLMVIALTKTDIDRNMTRAVHEEVAKWSSRENVDPGLWPKDLVGGAVPAPPICECSAVTADGCSGLLETLASRGLLRQRLAAKLDALLLHSTKEALHKIAEGDSWVAVSVGDEISRRSAMLGDAPFQLMSSGVGRPLFVWNAPPTTSSWLCGNSVCCRHAHSALIHVEVGERVSLSHIRLYQEVVLREGFLRDVRSVGWVVLGWHAPTRTVEASLELSHYCIQHDLLLVEVPLTYREAPDFDAVWQRILRFTEEYATDLLVARTQSHDSGSITPCPNAPCGWVGRPGDVETHLTTCPNVTVTCRWAGCVQTCQRHQREDHEAVCSHRPPTCHFCNQAFHGPLYEHLLDCRERAAFEATHAPCPLSSLGCRSTLVERRLLASHIDEERVQHIQCLAAAVTRLQNDLLEQERRHLAELENLKRLHATQVESLKGDVLLARCMSDKHQDALVEVNLQFRLVWEELDAMRRRQTGSS